MAYVFAARAHAQLPAGIDGRIVDVRARAIAGARVVLTPGDRRIVADDDGRFAFRNVEPGSYVVSVQRVGYRSVRENVEVTASGARRTIVMEAIPQLLDSVRIRERELKMRFSGVVLDDNGQPIRDVEVIIAGTAPHLHTDDRGRFALPGQLSWGSVLVRMRKMGFSAFFGTFTMHASREDTLTMSRLPQRLSPIELNEASGFGRDTFAFQDLEQRTRWRLRQGAGAMDRELLAVYGTVNLCSVVACANPSANCIILNGEGRTTMPASAFYVDQLELVEIYPPKSDWSGNLAARGCPDSSPTAVNARKTTFVIWVRKDTALKR